jgi:hypothetical protein
MFFRLPYRDLKEKLVLVTSNEFELVFEEDV